MIFKTLFICFLGFRFLKTLFNWQSSDKKAFPVQSATVKSATVETFVSFN